jgi:amidase
MKTAEYEQYDGLGLAELLRAGEVTPAELMGCAIELAAQRNQALNALCYPRFEEAVAQSRSASLKGRFGALPFLLKARSARDFLPECARTSMPR